MSSSRVTRGSRAQENALMSAALENSMKSEQLSSPPSTPKQSKKEAPNKTPATSKSVKVSTSAKKIKVEEPTQYVTPKSTRQTKAVKAPKLEEDPDELPHNLGKLHGAPGSPLSKDIAPVKKRAKTLNKKTAESGVETSSTKKKPAKKTTESGIEPSPAKKKTAKNDPNTPKKIKKTSNYGHTWGETPFPDYARPTPEECHEVTRLLLTVHPGIKAPKKITKASLTVAGCGNVPHVLDALVRTRLSANTSNGNSSRALQGLIQKFGTVKDPFGRKTVNYDAVRRGDVKDCYEAIKPGGLADRKSKDIKQILNMVYEENQARRDALLSSDKTAEGEERETEGEKAAEIEFADQDLLSLDYLHSFETKEAIEKMVTFPGIGMKTASCVALFCMQRPSFAVDTHVHRLCGWLGWVPSDVNVNRDQTFSHCEVRIPDELKYPLHQLLILHGRKCPRCRAITSTSSAGWEKGCVIEHLVKRTGVRKGSSAVKSKTGKASKKRKLEESEEEDEAELSEESAEDEADSPDWEALETAE